MVPRSKLIGDLVTPGLSITLHIPDASLNTLNLLVQLLYGVGVEVSEDVFPRLRSICEALGLGSWLEELVEKDIQADVFAAQIKSKEEPTMRDETLGESEIFLDPLDESVVCAARRSPRVQALQCELCGLTCYSLASLQRHYNQGHFAPASGKRVKEGRVVKSTPGKTSGGFQDCGARRSRRVSVSKTLQMLNDQECRVNLKDLKKQEGLLAEYVGEGKCLGSQLSESTTSAKLSENGSLKENLTIAVESSLVKDHVLDTNKIMKAAEDYGHFMKVAEECLISDTSMPMSARMNLKQRGRTQTDGRSSSKQNVPARSKTCPRKKLDIGLLLRRGELMYSQLKKGKNGDEDNNVVEERRKNSTSSPSTTPRLRSRQSKDGPGGGDVKETEKEEFFFLLWNKFLANKVIRP